MRALVLLVLLSSTAWAQFSIPGLPKSRLDHQRDAARSMAPARVELQSYGAAPVAELRTVRVRVWAARDYKQATFEWQSRFRRLIDRVNADVARWPGVRFELVETRAWDCASASYTMESLVDELERADRGDDVDLVVALVAAVPVVPSSMHNLGMARM